MRHNTKRGDGRVLSANGTLKAGACSTYAFNDAAGDKRKRAVVITLPYLRSIAKRARSRVSWLVENMLHPRGQEVIYEKIDQWKLPRGYEKCTICDNCDRRAKLNTRRGLLLWGKLYIEHGAR